MAQISLVLLLLLASYGLHGMEQLNEVTSWEQVSPFAGCIVAYTASSYYLNGNAYSVGENKKLRYGYVETRFSPWSSGETGYNMQRLLKKEAVPGNCALTNSRIREGSPSMRIATGQERYLVRKALDNGNAEFDYMNFNKEEIYAALDH